MSPSTPSYSQTRLGPLYFIAQALLCSAWWCWLTLDPAARGYFFPADLPAQAWNVFLGADLVFAVLVSALAGALLWKGHPAGLLLAWMVAGAMGYATLYCLQACWPSDSGWWSVVLMAPAAFFSLGAAMDVSVGRLPAFRVARPASRLRHQIVTVIQIVIFWTLFLAVIPHGLRFLEARILVPEFHFPGQRLIGSIGFLLLGSLGLWSGLVMASRGDGTPVPVDGTRTLVFSGPYCFIRNPMVVAGLGQGMMVGLGTGSWLTLFYAFCGGLIWQFWVRPAEELDLQKKFGASYQAYCSEVRCWIPKRRGKGGKISKV